MSQPEQHTLTIHGRRILATLDHDTASRILAAAGHAVPVIPDGCNTASKKFIDSEGRPSVAINQKGFTPELHDNEHQVNGCLILTLIDHQGLTLDESASRLQQAIKLLNQETQSDDL